MFLHGCVPSNILGYSRVMNNIERCTEGSQCAQPTALMLAYEHEGIKVVVRYFNSLDIWLIDYIKSLIWYEEHFTHISRG